MSDNDELDQFTDQGEDDALPADDNPGDGLSESSTEPSAPTPAASKQQVPLAALDEARNEARTAKSEAAELRQQVQLMNQRFQDALQMLGTRQQPQHDQPAPDPNFEDDPANNLNSRLARMEQLAQGMGQQQQAQAAVQQFMARIQPLEAQFVQQTPDYYEALQHTRTMVAQGMKAAGYSDQQILQQLTQQELQLAAHAMQQGQSPAQAAYARAKAMGWDPGKASTNAAGAPSQPKDAKKALTDLEAAQRAAQGLDGGGAEGGQDPNSLESLLTIADDAEFSRRMDRLLNTQGGRSEVGGLFND